MRVKIIVNKFDYATIVRNCSRIRETYLDCGKCALNATCDGPDSLEESCSIMAESLFVMGYIKRNMPNDEAVSETN